MSKDHAQTKKLDSNDDKERFSTRHKPWNYPDQFSNAQQNQNRTCCSPVDEIDVMDNEDENVNTTHSVEVQTKKSLFQLKQEKRSDINKKSIVPNANSKENSENKRMNFFDNVSQKPTNELQNVKLKKTGFHLDYQKITEKLVSKISAPEAFDEYTETDMDQPMDFTLCYSENLYEEKKQNVPYVSKTDFSCPEEVVEEEKNETVKSKGFLNKESRIKKEMFGNTSRSFKEIFNFFKDRDKKRIESTKVSLPEGTKLVKNNDTSDQKSEKLSQHSQQSVVEHIEKDAKSKNEAHCSQQTPLMFSRCSSLGSLSGYEQNSITDDRSSIISDISRRTSGVISPSELPDSPAQTAPPSKVQSKSQIGCFGKKKTQMLQQEKLKVGQCYAGTGENSLQHSENCFKKTLVVKRSVFEDNITAFKDESTPTKVHSMAASSLSSLTIDDDDDYEIINKIIINRDKENIPEESEIIDDRQNIADNTNVTVPSAKTEKNEVSSGDPNECYNEEENDELTDLTPYQEQLLDECIRRGIAKWTKQHFDEIKPFSWDLGLTCHATRTMLIRKFKMHLNNDFQYNFFYKTPYNLRNPTVKNNRVTREQSPEDETSNNNCEKYLNKDSEPPLKLDEANSRFDENSYYISYEEHLLDECIRRGMAKITKRNINEIRPFSWDANQICLTTRAMMLHGRDENIHGSH